MIIETDEQAKEALEKLRKKIKNDEELAKFTGISKNTIYKRLETGVFKKVERWALHGIFSEKKGYIIEVNFNNEDKI